MIDGCQRSIDEQYNNSIRKRVSEKENEDSTRCISDVDELEQLFKAKEWEK
jgi:hypothetical protein